MSNIGSLTLGYMNDWHDGYWLIPYSNGTENARKMVAVDVILWHTEGPYEVPEGQKVKRYVAGLVELIESGKITETVSESGIIYEVR